MDHVVDLGEVLLGGLGDERVGRLALGEAVHRAAVQVDLAAAVDEQLRDGAGHPGGVRHPDRLGDPEPGHVGGLADQRSAVGGEGEDAVEAGLDLRLAQGRQQQPALVPHRREVLLGERQHGGLPRGGDLVDLGQLVERDRHRAVGVGADAEPVVVLAVVEVLILVAQDRQARLDGLVVAPDQVGDLPGERVLVGERQQGHRHADHRPDLPAPEPRAAHDDVGRELAGVGLHAGDPPAVLGDAGDAHRPVEHRPAALGAPDQRGHRAGGLREPVGGGVQAAEDAVAVEQRVQARALLDVDDLGGHAPRGGPALLAVQVGEALRGRRDLETTDLVEAPVPVVRPAPEREELLDGVAREPAHRPRGVGREDEAGGVGGRAAGQ